MFFVTNQGARLTLGQHKANLLNFVPFKEFLKVYYISVKVGSLS